MLYSKPVKLTASELIRCQWIRVLIKGNAMPGTHDADAFHLVESAKYGGRYFITNDARLIKKASDIFEELFITPLKPSVFLAVYLECVKSDVQ